MTFSELSLGPLLAEGKTKVIYAHPEKDDVVYMVHKDGLSAGDGARRSTLPGKSKLACETTSNVFFLLEQSGIATHYVGMVGDSANIVTRCTMIPLEVVMRRIATGSFIRRNPEIAEGTRFEPTMVEFFFKDDALHDPLISEQEIVEKELASAIEVAAMRETGQRVFEAIEAAWAEQDVTLVDCKIEFGRTADGRLLVADVIDNDSWRIWPGGDKDRMLDKQVYRNMPEVTDERLRDLFEKYATVAEMTRRFVQEE